MSCTRTREVLTAYKLDVNELVIAAKTPIDGKAALAIVKKAKTLWVQKGKQALTLAPSSMSDAELTALVIGPTGKLRAPACRIGTTVIVGHCPDAFAALFGKR